MGNCQGKVFKSKITPLNESTTIEGIIINTKEPSNPDEDIDGKYIWLLQCVNDNYLQWSQNQGYVIAYGQNIQHHGKVWLRKPRNEIK